MLNKLDLLIESILQYNCITNVYGFARSFLALGLFLTIAINPIDVLFDFGVFEYGSVGMGGVLAKYSFFYILQDHLVLAKILSLLLLFVVIIGWRPRYTVILHWWLALSFFLSGTIVEGGDQISAILSFLIIPLGLSDEREWHWSKNVLKQNAYLRIINFLFYVSIRLQACIIYYFASSEKLLVQEWKDGTAVYYWFTHPIFGANDFILAILKPLIQSDFVAMLTWLVILIEVVLSMALVINKKYWKSLLWLGISFHFSIVLIHGLFSFFFAMVGLLILYLRPLNDSFSIIKLKSFFNLRKKNIGIFQ